MAGRTRRQWAVTAGALFAIIVFSEIASERRWPFYVSLLFLAAVWGVLSLAYRDTLGEITRRQLAISAMGGGACRRARDLHVDR